MSPRFFAACLLAGLAWSVSYCHGDEVVFRNGDRVTGKLDGLDGSKLSIDNTVGGKITVDLKDVRTFSSDNAIDVVLKDGSIVHAKVDGGPDGQITLTPAAGGGRNVPLTDLKKVAPPPVVWTGSLVIGGLIARGNTNTDQLNAAFDLTRRTDQDKIIVDAGYIYGREHVKGLSGKHETADDLFGSFEYDYYFAPKVYAYGKIRAEHDVIAGLDLRLTPNVGLGYQWIESAPLSFSTEAGVGLIYRKYAHDGDDTSPNARLAYHLAGKFNDKVSYFHNFEYLPGFDSIGDYFFDTDAGVRTTITKKMFTEVKVQYQYDSRPAPGKGRSDVRYILGVGWNF